MSNAVLEAPRRQTFRIEPLSSTLGAEVIGLDLGRPLHDEDFTRLRDAHHAHHVLVFRHQTALTPEQHIAFSRRWGPLQQHVLSQFALAGHPELLVVSNTRKDDGSPQGLGDAGVFWHSDLSYLPRPSLGSMLHAKELPAEGGDTLFANQHLAWERLPQRLQLTVRHLRAEHSYLKQYEELRRRNPWRPPLTQAQIDSVPPIWHPVVRRHMGNGRLALFVSEHFTTRVARKSVEASQPLLNELFAHSTQPEFVYRHRWQAGDLVFWDNRAVMHQATGCPPEQRRVLFRSTIEGDAPI
jgi:taurine dioxygenase